MSPKFFTITFGTIFTLFLRSFCKIQYIFPFSDGINGTPELTHNAIPRHRIDCRPLAALPFRNIFPRHGCRRKQCTCCRVALKKYPIHWCTCCSTLTNDCLLRTPLTFSFKTIPIIFLLISYSFLQTIWAKEEYSDSLFWEGIDALY